MGQGIGPATVRGIPVRDGLPMPAIPTIYCTSISRLPQSLGHSGPIWYGAGASFDRQTRTDRTA